MKFFRYLLIFLTLSFILISCKKETTDLWKTELKNPAEPIVLTDISKEFYDANVPLDAFKQKYPWFQGSVSDEDFAKRKTDAEEIKIYKDAIAVINQTKLQKDLGELFARIQTYFPDFKSPKVYLFSSALQMAQEPIIYQPQQQLLFIDITGFMGDKNPNYAGMEQYFLKSMNPQNIIPKVSFAIAETLIPVNGEHQKFVDILIDNGKIMTLQDAFLPSFPDYLKMNYTPQQYDWAKANESNIWNYFVENNLVFSDDARLQERFIAPGPFSKFYTEIDNQSSPQIGIFTGWQICKSFYKNHSDMKLQDFIKMNATEMFNQSQYKP